MATTSVARRLLGAERVPAWSEDLPRGGAARLPAHPDGDAATVFFPFCTGSIFAPAGGRPGVAAAFAELCARAGLRVRTDSAAGALCCGTPWRSKGLQSGCDVMRRKMLPRLWEASDGGRLPILSDASSCTEGLAQMVDEAQSWDDGRYSALRVMDSVAFAVRELLPRLTVHCRLSSLALHPTCSSTRLGLNADLTRLADSVAETVLTPSDWGCCGFAGDRGLLHPELTAAATAPEAGELAGREDSGHASCNRTCEVGMSRATGVDHRHVIEPLAEATRPASVTAGVGG